MFWLSVDHSGKNTYAPPHTQTCALLTHAHRAVCRMHTHTQACTLHTFVLSANSCWTRCEEYHNEQKAVIALMELMVERAMTSHYKIKSLFILCDNWNEGLELRKCPTEALTRGWQQLENCSCSWRRGGKGISGKGNSTCKVPWYEEAFIKLSELVLKERPGRQIKTLYPTEQ